MPQGVRVCKVCGREYPYCKTNRPAVVFRWQDVACSPDHAVIYFAKIAESRSKTATVSESEKDSIVTSEYVEDFDDEEDDFFESESDEEDEE